MFLPHTRIGGGHGGGVVKAIGRAGRGGGRWRCGADGALVHRHAGHRAVIHAGVIHPSMPHGGVIHSGIALRPLLASAMAHGFMLRRTSGCRHAGHRIGLRRGGLAMPHCGMFG